MSEGSLPRLVTREPLEGAGNSFNVVGLEAAGAAEFLRQDLINHGERLSLGLGEKALPFPSYCFALLRVRIFAELAHGFVQGAIFVRHVFVEIATHETAQGR